MEIKNKSHYSFPRIERIKIDNEISLQLESTPPTGPGETRVNSFEGSKNDPFKGNIA